jgi:hypothetical protein
MGWGSEIRDPSKHRYKYNTAALYCMDVRPDYNALKVVLLGMSWLGYLFF